MLSRLLALLGLLGLLSTAPAVAQVNVVPASGLITNILRVPTYTAVSVGLVPAASATDIFCISPGTAKSISVRQVIISGTAGTAITTPFVLYRRASLDTGGTAATGLALPVAGVHSTNDPASGATLTAYTANPTIVDSSPTALGALLVDLPVTTAAGGNTEVTRTFGTGVDFFNKGLDLQKNTTQQLCVNLNGASVSSGVLAISMTWQEQ